MAPIDPNELLKAFKPLLTSKGGIKNNDEVPRLSGLMRKYSKKLVSKCIYCNILLATDPKILEEFLRKDGWVIVNTWLKDAKENDNVAFLMELLRLLDHCPMTVSRIKDSQINTPKLTTKLKKHENPKISALAKSIIRRWMKMLETSESDRKSKKTEKSKTINENGVKKKRKKSTDEKNSSDDEANPGSNKNKKIKTKQLDGVCDGLFENVDTLLVNTSATEKVVVEKAVKVTIDSSTLLQSSSSSAKKADIELKPESKASELKLEPKPSTAKIRFGKSRSIGYTDGDSHKVSAKKSPSITLNKSLQKINNLSKGKISPDLHKSPLLVGPSKATTIKLSEGFMDAIIPVSEPKSLQKRKKRLSGNQPPGKPGQDERSDFIEEDGESSGNGDGLDVAEIDADIVKQIEADLRDDNAVTEGVECYEESYEENVELPTFIEPSSSPPPQVNTIVHNNVTYKSILCIGRKPTPNGKKKRGVTWPTDNKLESVREFELNENERTNVSRPAMFGESRIQDAKSEGQAMLSMRMGTPIPAPEKAPIEHLPWTILRIELPVGFPLVDAGYQSQERKIQADRHRTILPEFYPTKDFAPDHPYEPDQFEALASAHEAPKIIPLEDEANTNVSDYSNQPLPAPKTGDPLPGRIAHNFAPPSVPNGSAAHNSSFPQGTTPPNNRNPLGPPRPPNTAPQHGRPGGPRNSQDKYGKPQWRNSFGKVVCKFYSRGGTCLNKNCTFIHENPNGRRDSESSRHRDRDRDRKEDRSDRRDDRRRDERDTPRMTYRERNEARNSSRSHHNNNNNNGGDWGNLSGGSDWGSNPVSTNTASAAPINNPPATNNASSTDIDWD